MALNRILLSLTLAFLAVPPAPAQIVSGAIAGQIADPSGAAVPGASLILVRASTGAERRSTSDAEGKFVFPGIDGGEYSLQVTANGFRPYTQTGIQLSTGDRVTLGVLALALGGASETVTVAASANTVQTASSDRGDTITSAQIEGILVKGRNVTDLLQIVPGVVLENSDPALSGSVTMYVQGNRSTSNNISVDGVPQIDIGSAGSIRTPMSMNAVGEVKVMVSNYQAEHGRAGGSNIEMVTRAGTRQFHGEASYFMRREWLDANSFFNNRNGQARPRNRYNTIGVNLGGPIYLPGLFNKDRQKLFFFWNQEYWPTQTTTNGQVTVPTALERAGDFSQSVTLAGALIPVRDPFNRNAPFPGNVIPSSRIDLNSQALLKIFPAPNFSNRAISQGAYNYVFAAGIKSPSLAETVRVDYNANSNNIFSGSFSAFRNPQEGSIGVGNNANWPMLPLKLVSAPTTAGIRYTRIFTPSLINEFKVGALTSPVDVSAAPEDLKRVQRDAVGFKTGQLFPSANPYNIIPNATFGGVTGAANLSVETRFPRYNRYHVLNFSDNLTWTRGNHIFKAGFYYEYFHRIQKATNGALTFNGNYGFGIDSNNPLNTNYAYANATLGTYSTYTEASTAIWMHVSMRNRQAFLQDTWRPHARLTIDYGLRLYWISPIVDRDDAMDAFSQAAYDPKQAMKLIQPGISGGVRVGVNPATGATYPAVTIGALAPGVGKPYNGMVLATENRDYPRGMLNQAPTQLAPRAGFAWDVFGRGQTALRGGFGMAYEGYLTEHFGNNFVRQPPMTQVPTLYYGQLSQLLSAPAFTFPSTAYSTDVNGALPRIMNFSLALQQKVWADTIVDIAYAGSLGRHLQWYRNYNAVPLGANFLATNRDPSVTSNTPLTPNFLRPIPGYAAINNVEMAASSNYHSLQVSARRRFTKSAQFGAAWTWSKSMDYTDSNTATITGLVPRRSWYYGLAGFDRTHVVKINYVINLPNAPVQNRLLRGMLHGWEMSGITTFSSGPPLGVGFSTNPNVDITGTADLGARIVALGSPVLPKDQRTFSRWFDTSVFRLPAVGTLGNVGKTVLRGPGINNWDSSLSKNFPVRERLRLQMRLEAYNAFNHTQFSGVNTSAQFNPATGAQINGAFGNLTSARSPRGLQLAGRIVF